MMMIYTCAIYITLIFYCSFVSQIPVDPIIIHTVHSRKAILLFFTNHIELFSHPIASTPFSKYHKRCKYHWMQSTFLIIQRKYIGKYFLIFFWNRPEKLSLISFQVNAFSLLRLLLYISCCLSSIPLLIRPCPLPWGNGFNSTNGLHLTTTDFCGNSNPRKFFVVTHNENQIMV